MLRCGEQIDALCSHSFLSQGALIAGGYIGQLRFGNANTVFVNELVDFIGALSGQHLLDGSYFALVPKLVIADLLIIAGTVGDCPACGLGARKTCQSAQPGPIFTLGVSCRGFFLTA